MACDDHARRASSSCQKPQTRAEFAAPCTRISGGRSPSHTRRVGARSLDMRHILRGTKSHRIECGAFWIEEPRSGVPGTERTVTIVNSMRVLAVGVLVLLCHACDRTPPSSGPPEGSASREAAPAAPAPSSKPEAQRPVETHTPPRAEPPKAAASAPPVQSPPERAPASREVVQKPNAPDREKQPAPVAPAAPTPAAPPSAAPPAAPSAKVATLDLGTLEKRLRDTKAIGVFTKLSLKNQVDDLLSQFRTFHDGKNGATLTTLRESYDLLIMKVLSLLQDADAALARDIAASREAIWSLLADPVKFATLT